MVNSAKGRVVLVGAGPGDDGLITLKGKAWLERANVIVYDHLANASLLRFARKDAEIVYAGKKAGYATLPQEAIQALLIEKAGEGKTVVRLKGGDPFIFGRGGEEAQALKGAGIPFTVVPGVSSPVGVSSYAGIPLTHRDFASDVSIITGTTGVPIDWANIATRSGTLVFLMGARKLPRIVEELVRHGKDPATPIAIVQWGTTPKQKTWKGTLETIVETFRKEKIRPPALTLIGDVVNLKETVDWYETLPLFGKTVAITRAAEQSEGFAERLREKGAEPVFFPVIETVPPEDWTPLDTAQGHLREYYGLIFTSANGVRFFMRRLRENGRDIRDLKGIRLYAIGPKTQAAVEALGVPVDVVPEKFVAEGLLESLRRETVAGKRFLLPRAAVARETLPERLRLMGAGVDAVPAYRTLQPEHPDEDFLIRLRGGGIDVITFTASSTVKNFLSLAGPDMPPGLPDTAIACIGPITAKTAADHGLQVDIVPGRFTVEALADAIENHFALPSGGV